MPEKFNYALEFEELREYFEIINKNASFR